MEQLIPFIPAGVFIAFLIGVTVKLKDRPTWKDTDKTYRRIAECEERHKSINEKLEKIDSIDKTVQKIERNLDKVKIKLGIDD